MTARHTPWTTLLAFFVIGLFAGGLLALSTSRTGLNLLGATPIVPIILAILGIVVLILAWQVHRYVKGKNKKYDIRRAAPTLVMAKALEIVGSVLSGWYLGQLLIVSIHPASSWARSVIIQCGIVSIVAILDLVAGIVSEWWCTLPPHEGPDNPHRKQQEAARQASKETSSNNAVAATKPIGMQQ